MASFQDMNECLTDSPDVLMFYSEFQLYYYSGPDHHGPDDVTSVLIYLTLQFEQCRQRLVRAFTCTAVICMLFNLFHDL